MADLTFKESVQDGTPFLYSTLTIVREHYMAVVSAVWPV